MNRFTDLKSGVEKASDMQEAHSLFGFLPPDPPDETASKKGFAELIGVTPGRVSQLIAAGLPVLPNGRIHVRSGKDWVRANVDRNRRRSLLDEDPGLPRSPRHDREIADAELARLKADRLAGRLIDREATLRWAEGRARAERDAWIGWVNRAAPEIAAAGQDLGAVTAALDKAVREHLASLAETRIGDLAHD